MFSITVILLLDDVDPMHKVPFPDHRFEIKHLRTGKIITEKKVAR